MIHIVAWLRLRLKPRKFSLVILSMFMVAIFHGLRSNFQFVCINCKIKHFAGVLLQNTLQCVRLEGTLKWLYVTKCESLIC